MKIRKGFVSNSSSSSFICQVDISTERALEILEKILSCFNDVFGIDRGFHDVFKVPFIAEEGYLKDWIIEDPQYEYENNNIRSAPGKLVIESAGDNSIPYCLFGLLEDRFDAIRIHLG